MERFRQMTYSLLDIILPRSPLERTLASCTPATLAEKLDLREVHNARVLFHYQEPFIKHMIWSLKYRKNEHAADLLARLLADLLLEEIAEKKLFSERKALLVPIPLSSKRLRARGYNQMEFVLEKLSHHLEYARYIPTALIKVRETRPQTELPKEERLKNVLGAFSAPHPEMLEGHFVFLFDDVVTTGATLEEAARVLRDTGAEVHAIALAH